MERLELIAGRTDEIRRKIQSGSAQERIMKCLTENLPISYNVFDGLDLLPLTFKARLLRNSAEVRKILITPFRLFGIGLSESKMENPEKIKQMMQAACRVDDHIIENQEMSLQTFDGLDLLSESEKERFLKYGKETIQLLGLPSRGSILSVARKASLAAAEALEMKVA